MGISSSRASLTASVSSMVEASKLYRSGSSGSGARSKAASIWAVIGMETGVRHREQRVSARALTLAFTLMRLSPVQQVFALDANVLKADRIAQHLHLLELHLRLKGKT